MPTVFSVSVGIGLTVRDCLTTCKLYFYSLVSNSCHYYKNTKFLPHFVTLFLTIKRIKPNATVLLLISLYLLLYCLFGMNKTLNARNFSENGIWKYYTWIELVSTLKFSTNLKCNNENGLFSDLKYCRFFLFYIFDIYFYSFPGAS
jgi:hypothetical protein